VLQRRALLNVLICASLVLSGYGCSAFGGPTDPDPPAGSRTVDVQFSAAEAASQEQSFWCWAATVSNLFAFYGHRVSQSRIVTEVYGAPFNVTGGDYSNMARLLNRSWRDDSGRTFTAQLQAALDVPNSITTLSNDQIRDALTTNHPIVMGTTSHAMLVIGMTYTEANGHVTDVSQVRVFDPWPGRGRRTLTGAEIAIPQRGGVVLFIAYATVS
jgi:hypothetical protein